MSTTTKRKNLCLTKVDERQLARLVDYFEESESQIFRRALILLYHVSFTMREIEEVKLKDIYQMDGDNSEIEPLPRRKKKFKSK